MFDLYIQLCFTHTSLIVVISVDIDRLAFMCAMEREVLAGARTCSA